MEELDFREIFNIIKKKSWIIALSLIIMIVISILVSSFVLETEYKAFTTLIINDVKSDQYSEDFIGIVTNEKLIRTLKEIVKSSVIINEVIDNLELNQRFLEINKQVKASIVEDTGIIKIEVNNNNPKNASDIANEIADVFIEYVDNNSETLRVRVINKAQIPIKPTKPNLKLNIAIGGLLGIIIGIILVSFFEYIDDSLKTKKDIEEKIQLPVIGQIPLSIKNTNRKSKASISESYKMLRTNILALTKNDIRTILITSSGDQEGKSTIISNIAISMAQNNQKVLLIDSNLREPYIHQMFDISKYKGLTNELSDYNPSNINFVYPTKIKNLYVMPSGNVSTNSSEILGSNEMKDLLEEASNKYDLVLLDSPSLETVADGAVLSTMTDGTILICESGKTKFDKLKNSKEMLDKLDVSIIGVVLNKVN